VLRVDPEGRLTYANIASVPLLKQWSSGTGDLVPDSHRAAVVEGMKGKVVDVAEVVCDDATFSLSVSPLPEGAGVNVYALDVTERKQADTALRRANDELQRRVAALEQAEEGLRRYARIVSCSGDLLALHGKDFAYLAANDAYLDAVGRTRDDLPRLTVSDVFGPEVFEETIKPHAERCLLGERVHFEDWFTYPAAGRLFMAVTYAPYLGSGGDVEGVVVSARDITERKLREEEVLSLARFPSENPNPVLRLDGTGLIIYANSASAPLLDHWECAEGEPLPEPWQSTVLAGLEGNCADVAEVACANRTFSLSESPLPESAGVNVYALDITKRKRSAEALAASEERLSLVASATNDAVWDCDLVERTIWWNEAYDRLLGGLAEEGCRPALVAIAFEVQIVDEVPMGEGDVRVPLIVTEEREIGAIG
ncbi:PAS domain-containing protein, partial [bacterium]|nr:PAS domain-containing protein [bacterium]